MSNRILTHAISALALAGGVSSTALSQEAPVVTYTMLAPQTALELAQASMAACQKAGYQVAVAVVDRMGITQILLRDRFAGPHTPDTARRKAWTAVSFRTDTNAMVDLTRAGEPQSGVRFVDGALMIGGGIPVEVGGAIVGAVGVSGAPGGKEDHACAQAGIDAVIAKLEL